MTFPKNPNQSPPLLIARKRIFQIVWKINLFLLVLICLGTVFPETATAGAIIFVCLLTGYALEVPEKAIFILFGIKFVFDGLWFLRIPGYEQIGILHLFLLPLMTVVLAGNRNIFRGRGKIIFYLMILYLCWIIAAVLLNDRIISPELIIRHAGPVLGVLLGTKYIRKKDDLDFMVLLVCLSSFIPTCVLLVQYILANNFAVEIFFGKYDSIRGFRFSGFYYDPATMGLINIITFLSIFYLLTVACLSKRIKSVVYIILVLNIIASLVGQTRSVLGVLSILVILYSSLNMRKSFYIVLLVIIAGLVFIPKVDSVVNRSSRDVMGGVTMSFGELMTDRSSRTLLTGRVGLWQDVWFKFNSGSDLQQLFGAGERSNAHSSYFYLLLVTGYVGVLFYLFIHALLIYYFLNGKYPWIVKWIGAGVVFSLLAVGIAMNVTVYTSYQWILYMVLAGLLNMTREKPVQGYRATSLSLSIEKS